jgi:hypothetical protein
MAKHHEISHGFYKQGKALKNPHTMCFNPVILGFQTAYKTKTKTLIKEDFIPSTAADILP